MQFPSCALLSLLLAAAISAPATAHTAIDDTSVSAPAPTLDAVARKHVIETAIAKMSESYVFPARLPAIVEALRAGLASGRYAITDPKAFTDAVNRDIAAVANDRHMRLLWSPDPLPSASDPTKIDQAMLQRQADFFARINYGIPRAEVLDGNIGYLKIDGFVGAEKAGPTLVAAMAFLKHSDAMIIDLRDSRGGDPATVAMIVSYLVPSETLINTFHRRDKAIDDQIWASAYVPGGRWSIDKPVYVLTSDKTASASEEFAYDMQQLKRGTVIGGVTWGGANPGGMEALDRHFSMFVPNGAAVNPISKTNWEGVGVKPDVAIDPPHALDTARQMALEKLIERASGQRRIDLQNILDSR